MQLIYFDEVKPQHDFPHYILGALAIDESNIELVENKVNEISERVFSSRLLNRSTEFHAVDIYSRKGLFKTMSNVYERHCLLLDLFEVLRIPELKKIYVRINVTEIYNKNEIPKYAFMYLCEKANSLMKAEKSLGMLIGDRENDVMAYSNSVALSQYRISGTNYVYREKITHLIDTVHFTPSHLSRFIQLADIYSWYLQFQVKQSSKFKSSQSFADKMKERDIKLFPSKYKIWP